MEMALGHPQRAEAVPIDVLGDVEDELIAIAGRILAGVREEDDAEVDVRARPRGVACRGWPDVDRGPGPYVRRGPPAQLDRRRLGEESTGAQRDHALLHRLDD